MKILRCACLVDVQDERLLLVRVRENVHWYLPGGKMEPGELPEQALRRELLEELEISLDPSSVRYLYTVHGPAYGEPGEVSEVAWIDMQETERFAPAVQLLCADYVPDVNIDSPGCSG